MRVPHAQRMIPLRDFETSARAKHLLSEHQDSLFALDRKLTSSVIFPVSPDCNRVCIQLQIGRSVLSCSFSLFLKNTVDGFSRPLWNLDLLLFKLALNSRSLLLVVTNFPFKVFINENLKCRNIGKAENRNTSELKQRTLDAGLFRLEIIKSTSNLRKTCSWDSERNKFFL